MMTHVWGLKATYCRMGNIKGQDAVATSVTSCESWCDFVQVSQMLA